MSDTSRRDFAKLIGILAVGSAIGEIVRPAPAWAKDAVADPLAFVDPELRPAARMVREAMASFPSLSAETLPMARSANAAFSTFPPLPNVPVAERRIPGAKGQPDVTVYIINAKPGASQPGILHTHGGGFVVGSAKSGIHGLQQLATALNCTVVTVEYRLAPETRYSGSIEDNYAGLRWMHANAAEIGVDPNRIAVMGESAGGGHAALLAITARDRGEVPVLFQSLIYPMLDDRTGSSREVPPHIGTIVWDALSNRFGWDAFLGQNSGGGSVPDGAVPARVANLSGLPPAFIGVGSIDLFVDEDLEYARRLVAAGVPTEFLLVPGAFHGFDGAAKETSVAKRFTEAKIYALKRAFEQT